MTSLKMGLLGPLFFCFFKTISCLMLFFIWILKTVLRWVLTRALIKNARMAKCQNSKSQIITNQTWLQNFCELFQYTTLFLQRKSHSVINHCNHPTMLRSCIFFEIFMQDGSINLQTFDLMDVSTDKV